MLAAIPALAGAAVALALRDHAQASRAAVLVTGAYATAMIVIGIRQQTPSAAPSPPPAPRGEAVQPLAQLAGIERSVALSRSSALEFEHRVQPQLRRTASERLKLRHGIDLDRNPEAARSLLGEATWSLLTMTHPRDDRSTRPPGIDAILGAIERLEEV